MAEIVLEVCVDTDGGLAAALRGGADRIELCAALGLGGLTPSAGLMRRAAAAPVPVHALIRPRAGGFAYDAGEVAMMLDDIAAARAAGLAGVVIGAARPDGRLDLAALRRMVAAAGPLAVTLSRVFDLVPDCAEALDQAVDLGVGRILTSGGAATAAAGLERLAAVGAWAAGRIGILPGAGISAENVGAILARLPVGEVHASCSAPVPVEGGVDRLGFAGPGLRETREEKVRALKAALAGLA